MQCGEGVTRSCCRSVCGRGLTPRALLPMILKTRRSQRRCRTPANRLGADLINLCPNGHDNPDGHSFCGACGAELPTGRPERGPTDGAMSETLPPPQAPQDQAPVPAPQDGFAPPEVTASPQENFPPPENLPPPEPQDEPRSTPNRTWVWVAVAAAGALVIFLGVAYALGSSKAREANDAFNSIGSSISTGPTVRGVVIVAAGDGITVHGSDAMSCGATGMDGFGAGRTLTVTDGSGGPTIGSGTMRNAATSTELRTWLTASGTPDVLVDGIVGMGPSSGLCALLVQMDLSAEPGYAYAHVGSNDPVPINPRDLELRGGYFPVPIDGS